MSALTPIADIRKPSRNVRQVPEAEIRQVIYLRSIGELRWLSLDLAHVPMVHGRQLTVVPGDRDRIPTDFGNTAAIGTIAVPIDATALPELFGFGGRHRYFLQTFADAIGHSLSANFGNRLILIGLC